MVQTDFHFNCFKGRMAEQLIQELFIQNNYNVFNYGLERLHPSLSKMLKDNQYRTGKELRFMPDFVVQSNENGDLFYLEVKFRANSCFCFDEKYKDYPYKNAWFVVVSPEKIQCMHYKRLKAGDKITSQTNFSLSRVRSFHFDKKILEEYTQYAKKIFQGFK